jgi:hypothetical protein
MLDCRAPCALPASSLPHLTATGQPPYPATSKCPAARGVAQMGLLRLAAMNIWRRPDKPLALGDRTGTVDAGLEAICVLPNRTGFVVVAVVVIVGIMLMSHQ